jgi:hypothetical protein
MQQPNGEAERLINSPLLNKILDGMEASAIEAAVTANPSDDEQRRISAMEVRAIRSLRKQLKALAEPETKPAARGSVA